MHTAIDHAFTKTKIILHHEVAIFFCRPENGALLLGAALNFQHPVDCLVPTGFCIALGSLPTSEILAIKDGLEFGFSKKPQGETKENKTTKKPGVHGPQCAQSLP